MNKSNQQEFEHAWKYFEIHANQRMQMFNYYIAITSALLAGFATTIQNESKYLLLGAMLGLMIIFVSFIFWKLDCRTSFLIKHAEVTLKRIEFEFHSNSSCIFSKEAETLQHAHSSKLRLFTMWTYSESFNFLFKSISTLGFICLLVCLYRFA